MGKNRRHLGKGQISKESKVIYEQGSIDVTSGFQDDDEFAESLSKGLSVKLYMWEFGQNDPDRDSGSRMRRLGYAEKLKLGHTFTGIVLSSETNIYLSPADSGIISRNGLAGINCSWNRISEIPFEMLGKGRNQRLIPLLIAANTVNYGKPSKLNTAEAMAASLYITGFQDDARSLLQPYSYGEEFLRMNQTSLEAYASCRDSAEVVCMQQQFLDDTLSFKQQREDLRNQRRLTTGVVADYLDEDDLPPLADENYLEIEGDDSNEYFEGMDKQEGLTTTKKDSQLLMSDIRPNDVRLNTFSGLSI